MLLPTIKLSGLKGLLIDLAVVGAFWPIEVNAMDSPQPPCGDQVRPPYSGPNEPPNIQVWNSSTKDWVPPSCTGWTDQGYRMLIALAATFRFNGSAKDLLGRFGRGLVAARDPVLVRDGSELACFGNRCVSRGRYQPRSAAVRSHRG